jgi:hypothetical protein
MSKSTHQSVTLDYPITWEGAKIAEVTVKRPKVKDIKSLSAASQGEDLSEFESSILVIAALSGLPAEAVEELDQADFQAISEVVGGFFPKATAPATGGAS